LRGWRADAASRLVTTEARRRATAGLALFVTLSFLGSWFVAAALRVLELNVAPAAIGTRLFSTSLLYAVTMGWQPLVATWVVRRWIDPPPGRGDAGELALDLGLRPARPIFSVVGAAAALGFVLAAIGVAWAAATLGHGALAPLHGAAEPLRDPTSSAPASAWTLALPVAFAGTFALVWLQAFTEEIGWRGYFLPSAMARFGRWPGLLLHGAVWGAWYAPVLFFTSYGALGGGGSLGRSLSFALSCTLLGTLLGWLRLASRSIGPAVVANIALTLAAGVPYVVHGVDAGLRSAALGPAGWVLLALAIAALARSRFRLAVQVPAHASGFADERSGPHGLVWVASVLEAKRPPRDRDLLN
jgi:uncharacterized protein